MLPVTPEQFYTLLVKCVRPLLALLPSGLDVEQKRKSILALGGILLGIPTMLSFVIVDTMRRDTVGAIFDGGLLLLMVVSLALLTRSKRGLPVYRLMVVGLIIDFNYNSFFVPTGDSSLIWLLIFPPVVFYLLGIPEGIYWFISAFVMNVMVITLKLIPPVEKYTPEMIPRFYVVWGFIAFLSFTFELLRWRFYDQLLKKRSALEDALDNVRTLNGLIPICSICKRIRDDKGYWNHLEEYLSKNTDAMMTHGICDACIQTHYSKSHDKRLADRAS